MKKTRGLEKAKIFSRRVARTGAEHIKAAREGATFNKAHNRNHSYLHDIGVSKNPALSQIVLVADWLALRPEELIELAREENAAGAAKLLRPPKKVPRLIRLGRKAFADADPGESGAEEMAESLVVIDALRYRNPVLAQQELRVILPGLPRRQLPFWMNIAGSCHRMLLEFSEAALAVRLGREQAIMARNPYAVGDHYQREVYLLANVGRKRAALGRTVKAREQYLDLGSMKKVAETIVDRGYCLTALERFEEALQSYLLAGRFDGDLDFRHSAAWRQGACRCFGELEQWARARSFGLAAIRLAEGVGDRLLQGQSEWILGRAAADGGKLRVAEAFLRIASERLRSISPADSVLAVIDLATLYLKHGRDPRRLQPLDQLASFLEEFTAVPPVAEALQNLYAAYRMHRLSTEGLESCAAVIQANRAHLYLARAA